MSEAMKKAQNKLKDVLHEFEPSKGHFVTGTREFLLAFRSAVDAQIALLDKVTKKKPGDGEEQGGA